MRKYCVLLLFIISMLSSCSSFSEKDIDAEEKLVGVLDAFSMHEGVLYSTRDGAKYALSDSVQERMFFYGKDISSLTQVESAAAYFSRRFSEEEIVVLKLFDLSYREEVMALCKLRASKKENAIVFCDGVYVYLVCTKQNEEIRRFLK